MASDAIKRCTGKTIEFTVYMVADGRSCKISRTDDQPNNVIQIANPTQNLGTRHLRQRGDGREARPTPDRKIPLLWFNSSGARGEQATPNHYGLLLPEGEFKEGTEKQNCVDNDDSDAHLLKCRCV